MKKDDLLKILDAVKTLEDQDIAVSILDSGGKDLYQKLLNAFPEIGDAKTTEGFDTSELRSLILKKHEVVVYSPIRLSKEIVSALFDSLNTSKKRIVLNCKVDSDLTAGLKLVLGGKIYDFTLDRFLIDRIKA